MKPNQKDDSLRAYTSCYCLSIQGREFSVQTDSEGFIHFEDSQRVSFKLILNEVPTENRILLMAPDALRAKLENAEETFERLEHKLCPELTKLGKEVDKLLLPYFWENVNPRLCDPLAQIKEEVAA